MTPTEVREFCSTEESAQSLLKAAMKQLYLSARAFHRILKLARTIADLENANIIKAHHLAEASSTGPGVRYKEIWDSERSVSFSGKTGF
jgi:magnesium chelatase family protein